jgi:hypothetical protein
MNDLITLCLLGIFVIVGLMLLMRLFSGVGRGYPGGQGYGGENPQYDDPNIRSRGFFGRSGGSSSSGSESQRYDAPNIRSRGFFGRSGGGSSSSGSQPSGRVDDPNIRSRGGFGRSKK